MAKKYSLKDALFNPISIHKIASEIKCVYEAFEQEKFEAEVISDFIQLELKARITHIAYTLAKYLPYNYQEAGKILIKALPSPLDTNKKDDDFGSFIYASYSEFIKIFGCVEEHLVFSLYALREITKRCSVEFSIRDFINSFPKETFEMLHACAISSNYHERRLASEGSRPKLPWAKSISTDYTLAIKILDILYTDKTRYVTRSVANHLNDIAKIDAPLVIETLKRWKASDTQETKEMPFILSHSLRTLIKSGNTDALALLGYLPNPSIKIQNFTLSAYNIRVGELLDFSFNIIAKEEVPVMIDYILYFQSKSGKKRPKVYKLKKLRLLVNTPLYISKKHIFKANMTTRKFYAGEHTLVLQINGQAYEQHDFMLQL